jgi:quercetin dioxygenase-like cupin family protein
MGEPPFPDLLGTDVKIGPAGLDNFSGEVWTGIVAEDAVKNNQYRLFLVQFAPMGRTKWHKHAFVQHLIVLAGVAMVGFEDGRIERVSKGESIQIQPNTVHWHGATRDAAMAHLAVNFEGTTDWTYPAVSPDEYASFEKRTPSRA